MPLLLGDEGSEYIIKNIGGDEKCRHYLLGLGFLNGTKIRIVSKFNGYILVEIKDSRIGLSKELAKKIIL